MFFLELSEYKAPVVQRVEIVLQQINHSTLNSRRTTKAC